MSKDNKTPEIRFAGFTDAWEQRKLGEIVKVGNGKDYKHLEEGNIPVYGTGGYMLSVSEALSDNEDAIGIGRKGTIDKPYILRAPFWTVDTLFYCIPNENYDLNFAFDIFQNINWKMMDESTGVPSLSKTAINNVDVFVPSFQEQKKIGSFFEELDNTITLHQRKCDTLQKFKKSMLQKMFPKNGESVPEIRFDGFTDAWEQRKLDELLENVSKKNSEGQYSQDDILACSLGTELDKKTIFFGLRSTEESVKSYRVVNIGDVIYTKSPIKGYPNGIVRTCKITDGIVPSLYCVYKKKDNISIPIDTRFIQSYLEDKGRLEQYLNPLVNVGARNNVNITDKEFLVGTIMLPSTLNEQVKIVSYLEELTNLITLHQRKLETLKKLKKAMLQKMFV